MVEDNLIARVTVTRQNAAIVFDDQMILTSTLHHAQVDLAPQHSHDGLPEEPDFDSRVVKCHPTVVYSLQEPAKVLLIQTEYIIGSKYRVEGDLADAAPYKEIE